MTATPLATIQSVYAAFGRGDVPAILATLSPDVKWACHAQKTHPLAGPVIGPEAVGGWFGRLAAGMEFTAFEVERLVADGDIVVALGHEASIVKPTGRRAASRFAHVWTLRDGKVVQFDDFHDTSAVVAALA
jgi:ketosteroid isomerase-like protein